MGRRLDWRWARGKSSESALCWSDWVCWNVCLKSMEVTYRNEMPSASMFTELFETTGWNQTYKASPAALGEALQNSWYSISAYESEQLVGFGRVVSDGVLYAMIYDLIVSPSHQGRGIGSEILTRLIQNCRTAGIRDVQLFSAAEESSFYERFGFVARAADSPGMYLSSEQEG